MALSDPQSVTVSGTAIPLPRTGLALLEGGFSDSSRQTVLTVQHSSTRRTRHIIKLQKSLIVSDPIIPSQNQNVNYSAHFVIDMPKNGVSTADATALANALILWATPANLTKVAGGES